MSVAKNPKKSSAKKKIVDVEEPGKTAPSSTSKPVIVTNRPILKDPMVTPKADESAEPLADETKKLKHSAGSTIKPIDDSGSPKDDAIDDQPDAEPEKTYTGQEAKTEAEPSADEETEDESKTTDQPAEKSAKKTKPDPEAEAAEQTKHDAAVQKLADSKKYELPINAVEKRKTKHFVALGVVLAVLLALAWGDIAADAGLIRINGVKPVTHFFSN